VDADDVRSLLVLLALAPGVVQLDAETDKFFEVGGDIVPHQQVLHLAAQATLEGRNFGLFVPSQDGSVADKLGVVSRARVRVLAEFLNLAFRGSQGIRVLEGGSKLLDENLRGVERDTSILFVDVGVKLPLGCTPHIGTGIADLGLVLAECLRVGVED
jgi:hypothetical protein